MADVCAKCAYLNWNNKSSRSVECYWCKEVGRYVEPTERACRYYIEKPKQTNSGCFITTVVVDILGYDDDCYILQTLRKFRDKFLQINSEYHNLLLTYDAIGPLISENLRNSDSKEEISLLVSQYYLLPICRYIESGDYYSAISSYIKMVKFLQNQVCVDSYVEGFEYDPTISPEKMGHGRALVRPVSSIN